MRRPLRQERRPPDSAPGGRRAHPKRVLVHLGLPKTGTTTIQNFFAAEAEALEAEGVLFPNPRPDVRAARRVNGIGHGWHRALSSFGGRKEALAPGEWEAWQAEFRRFAESDALHTMILSQESLSLSPKATAAVLTELPHDLRIVLVLVLRPAEAWLTSLYEQMVRSPSRTADMPESFRFATSYADQGFAGLVRQLKRRSPAARLRPLSFDDLLAGDGLVPNFCRAFGMSEETAVRARSAQSANAGLPQDMVAFLRAANAAAVPLEDFLGVRRALARAARERTASKRRTRIFPAELASRIDERYALDRAYFLRRHGLELAPARIMDDFAPLACDPAALRAECARYLGDAAATFDAVARTM